MDEEGFGEDGYYEGSRGAAAGGAGNRAKHTSKSLGGRFGKFAMEEASYRHMDLDTAIMAEAEDGEDGDGGSESDTGGR